jgi:SAM domain (Sterile alpha motif)
MDVVVWPRNLGLGKYEAIFRENEIDETVLPSLTHENLRELGVTALGHRLKLLDAIAALRSDALLVDAAFARQTTYSPPRALHLAPADTVPLKREASCASGGVETNNSRSQGSHTEDRKGRAKLSSWPSGSIKWKKRSPHSAS